MKRQNGFLIALVLCLISTMALAATNFPDTSLDSYSTKSSGDTIAEGHINDPQDAIEAIEAKLGTGTDLTPADGTVLIGTSASASEWDDVPVDAGGTGSGTASGARTNLGLVIGTNVAAPGANTDITSLGGITTSYGNKAIFNVVSYEGNATDNRTVAHGLGRTPVIVICMADPNDYQGGANWWVTGMTATHSMRFDGLDQTDGAKSVDATNVTLGTNANWNSNAKTYLMIVF